MTEALNWISLEEIEAKLGASEEQDWDTVVYGNPQLAPNTIVDDALTSLKPRGQHVRR
ncbi:hypothetical protein SEA_A3WALLY_259 [Microbacterium phage A3Wally]|nr:hypothetical protein SEA_A3WALLY_259 [Microbacterium phage A3Wally]